MRYNNLILFDGVCNVCNSSVQFVIRRDPAAIYRFASLQSELGKEVCRSAGMDPESLQSIVLVQEGRVSVRSDAILEILRGLGRPWSWFAVFKWLPRGFRDALYSLFAKHRYRWFGRRESCMVPSESIRKRFVG